MSRKTHTWEYSAWGLEENKVYDKGNVVKGHQNGTVENFRFFDYSWSKVKNISSEGVNTFGRC